MTVTCLHCGVVPVPERDVRHITGILDALAVGAAPLAAITCPQCREEVRAKWVNRDIRDDTGRIVAPVAGNVLPTREAGPWDGNGR